LVVPAAPPGPEGVGWAPPPPPVCVLFCTIFLTGGPCVRCGLVPLVRSVGADGRA
jgi:hypothetical protein